ncbi:MAG: endonuclease III [Lachnospiraceae bacterium]|nr:endonuclease III [Lachnospiraceae bacterium]
MASKRTIEILNIIDDMYGTDMRCYLNHDSAWQLLIATILSAQCTDARVNIVTESLFKKYPSIKAFADANLEELENDIKPAGFQHSKATNIIGCCQKLHYEFNDEVPKTIEELTSLPGVGRKTANVIRGNIYNDPSIVVDTHVKRISNRLGLTKESDPVKIEFDLMKKLPKDHWILYNIQIITFGRDICTAKNPKCDRCKLKNYCNE